MLSDASSLQVAIAWWLSGENMPDQQTLLSWKGHIWLCHIPNARNVMHYHMMVSHAR